MPEFHPIDFSVEPVGEAAPGRLEVVFAGADGTRTAGPALRLPAGKVGTWELTFHAGEDLPAGGDVLFQRRGFLLGHRTQDTSPRGRDYVTLEARTSAKLNLIVNVANQSHQPGFAQVRVVEGVLRAGEKFTVRVGDRREGGPGGEVYDATTEGRLVAAVGSQGVYRALAMGPVRVRITSEPKPDLLRVLGPSIAAVDEPFDLHVMVFDPHRNVCEQYAGAVRLRGPEGLEGLPETVDMNPAHGGVRIVENVRIRKPGVYRIEAHDEPAGLTALSNPLICQEAPERRLLWGDFHSHAWGDTTMALMDEPNFKLHPEARHTQARRVGRLDFAAPGPMSPPKQADCPELWRVYRQAYEKHDAPGRYVPFLASEVHARPGGDRNVVYLADEPGHMPGYATMDELQATYGGREDVILEAHVGGGPPDWARTPTPKEPLVEVVSGHGAFEWLLQQAIARGYRPAVIGSGDIHLPTLGAPMAAHCFRGRFNKILNIRDTGFGSGPLAAVWAAQCGREAIWEAVRERRTFATTGARIILETAVDGCRAGGETRLSGPARVSVTAHGCAPVQRVDLIRNDRCLKSWYPDAPDVELEYVDARPLREGAYYVRLRQADGEYAWSTPVWAHAAHGAEQPDASLPLWNAHEDVDPGSLRPNGAEVYEADLRAYLELEEDPALFSDLTPAGLLNEVTGRSALFYACLEPQHIPVAIRWYYEFSLPRIHLDWGFRDFGMRSGV